MRKEALKYYSEGYNCSQCILKAAEASYGIPINKQSMRLCQGINMGFGIGGMCSIIIAGIMVFGLLFDEQTTKRLRISLLDKFNEKYSDLNCEALKRKRTTGLRCEELVADVADMVDVIIQEERRV